MGRVRSPLLRQAIGPGQTNRGDVFASSLAARRCLRINGVHPQAAVADAFGFGPFASEALRSSAHEVKRSAAPTYRRAIAYGDAGRFEMRSNRNRAQYRRIQILDVFRICDSPANYRCANRFDEYYSTSNLRRTLFRQ